MWTEADAIISSGKGLGRIGYRLRSRESESVEGQGRPIRFVSLPVCQSMWLVKCSLRLKLLPQISQRNGVSLVWERIWLARCSLRVYFLPQTSHWCGVWPGYFQLIFFIFGRGQRAEQNGIVVQRRNDVWSRSTRQNRIRISSASIFSFFLDTRWFSPDIPGKTTGKSKKKQNLFQIVPDPSPRTAQCYFWWFFVVIGWLREWVGFF